MNVVQELIEQLVDQEPPRSLQWACALLTSLGVSEPLAALRAMHRDGVIELRASGGAVLPAWQCQAVFRGESRWAQGCHVVVTGVPLDA